MSKIKKVLIVGAGTMGHSLALLFASKGVETNLADKSADVLERAVQLIASASKTMVTAGFLQDKDVEKIPRLIHPFQELKAASREVDLAIEAVDEVPETKRGIFEILDRYCPPHSILASNTSALNIFDIVQTGRPEKVLITHFFAPPHIIPLVEIVPGDKTDMKSIDTVMTFLKSMGKETLLLKAYVPGFVVNRIQRAIAREAFSLVDRGVVSIEDMDRAVKTSLGIRLPIVGVLQTYDFTGLDVYSRITKETHIAPPTASTGPPKIVEERVQKGEFGIKTGRGLYDYSGRSREEVLENRDLNYLNILSALKATRPL